MDLNDITIGSDPEFFITDEHGTVVMPDDLTTGTKLKPQKVFVTPGRFYIGLQRDGMSLEWTLPPGKLMTNMLSRRNAAALWFIQNEFLRKYNEKNGTSLRLTSRVGNLFSHEVLAKVPIDHRRIGCSPDFYARDGQPIDRASLVDADNVPLSSMRYVGGHMHIGWTKNVSINDPSHLDACRLLTKGLGYLLSCVDHDRREAQLRSLAWSSALSYRPTSYGVEIRAPTTYWLLHPHITKQVQLLVIKFLRALLLYGPKDFYYRGGLLLHWHNNERDEWTPTSYLMSGNYKGLLFRNTPEDPEALLNSTLASSNIERPVRYSRNQW